MKSIVNDKDISFPDLVAAIIFWSLTVGWIILLFYLSSETGTVSTGRSSSVLEFVEMIFGKGVMTEAVLRKTAHVLEYAVLTVFSFFSVRFTNRASITRSYSESPVKLIKSDNEMYIAFSMWLSLLTAVVDEYHQLFVDGRDGSIRDVLIDSVGIVIVLIIIRVVFTFYLYRLGRKELRYD